MEHAGKAVFPMGIANLTLLVSLNVGNHASGYFKSRGLKGTLPIEIGLTTDLRTFLISTTEVAGTIPTEIAMSSKLARMSFGGNEFTGTVQTEMQEMTELTALSLCNNNSYRCGQEGPTVHL